MRLLCLSLALSLIACFAAALGGCSSAAPSTGEPELEDPSVHSLPTAAQPEVEEDATVSPAARPEIPRTPTATAGTVKRSRVSATAGHRPEPVSSPSPRMTPEHGAAPILISESPETQPSETTEDPRPDTAGYVLTADQEHGTPQVSNAEPSVPERFPAGISSASGAVAVQGQADPVEGQPYTWEDGDRTLKVLLQPDLTIGHDGEITVVEESQGDDVTASSRGDVLTRSSESDIGRKTASLPAVAGEAQPVFRSESGELMTLPGGVLLALDPEWSEEESNAFFSGNGIELSRVSGLGFISNGFIVETEPGFPSLDLANVLSGQDGVVLSSPNWWTEVSRE